jgi:hypothetical protein
MHHIYHRVPENFVGNILYPLNLFNVHNFNLYEKQASKYKGREHVMGQIIPTLDCKWNDVLHFSPVHPGDIKEALLEAGGKYSLELKYYEINPNLLEKKKTTVYLYAEKTKLESMGLENFTEYFPNELEKYSVLSQSTKDYYKETIDKGERPLLFVKVPHVLYRGSLDVSSLRTILV